MQNLNKWLKGKLRRHYREWQIRQSYHQSIPDHYTPGQTPFIIHVLDNKRRHGGLLDRIKGIISSYLIAAELGYGFKVYVDAATFNLFKFLTPKDAGMVCETGDFLLNAKIAKPLYLYNDWPASKDALLSRFKGNYQQFHVYGNLDYTALLRPELDAQAIGDFWGNIFRQLFNFSAVLTANTPSSLACNSGSCTGIHARFMSLLGDFEDVNATSLNEENKQLLLEQCLQQVCKIAEREKDQCILIVSDSASFLLACRQMGENRGFADRLLIDASHLGHIDMHYDEAILQKAFLDFYLLCGCSRIYQLLIGGMYHSQFSRYASYLANGKLVLVKEEQ